MAEFTYVKVCHLFLFIMVALLCVSCKEKSRKKYQCFRQNDIHICSAPKKTREEACSSENEVVIIVSPKLNEDTSRRLQIIWNVAEVKTGDIIRLYKTPKFHDASPIFVVVPYTKYGISTTNIFESFLDIGFKFAPICLGYYVAYWRKNKVLYSSCLQTNPNWMERYNFGKMRLIDMFIPGTHDSSAYHTAYSPQSINRLDNYVYTQEENILEQLLHGARALDLRVGKDKGIYFANHKIAQLYPFQYVLNNLTTFLDRTNEVLILDFHEFFVGFPELSDHMAFVDYIYDQMGPYMVPPSLGWSATLQDIWDTGRRLIISYNQPEIVEAHKDILWPSITQVWGNKQTVVDLYDFLAKSFANPPKGMWAAQSELTATAKDILTNDLGGLREMATQTNTLVSKWFHEDWGFQCHIVAMDFIRASYIVDVAIEMNLRKSFRKKCPKDKKKLSVYKKPPTKTLSTSDEDDS